MEVEKGNVSFPGINGMERVQFTDSAGIYPAVGLITFYEEYGFPQSEGDLKFTYQGREIVIKHCHVENISYDVDAAGKLCTVRILDERWKWKKSSITLRANQKLPDGFTNPLFEVTPQQLAAMCFEAIGVTQYDVSRLPNTDRPDINWDHAVAAQELANLVEKYGCRIVPKRSNGSWVVWATGEGGDLPDLPFTSDGSGFDPKEIPHFIKIVTAPIQVQMAVELEAAGKTTGLVWDTLANVAASLTPNPAAATSPYGFRPFEFANVDSTRFTLPDGTKKSKKEFAEEFIYRAWRIRDDAPFGKFNYAGSSPGSRNIKKRPNKGTIFIPGYKDLVFRKQMIITNQLVQTYTDGYNEQHNRPAFMFGVWRVNRSQFNENFPFGTRIDAQTADSNQLSLEERVTFSIQPDPLDSDKTILFTSQRMIRVTNSEVSRLLTGPEATYDVAKLWLMCAVMIKNLQTFQPERYEYYFPMGTGTDKRFVHEVIRDDIKPYFIQNYPLAQGDELKTALPRGDLINNKADVDKQCLTYASSLARMFESVTTRQRNYTSLAPIDLDGAIQQVSYSWDRGSGFNTRASRGSEHNYEQPSYAEKRQRDGRMNPFAFRDLINEIVERREALKGTYNT